MAKTVKRYIGNKSPSSLYPKIINQFPAHKVYWELFAGSAQILRKKKPARLNIVCEKEELNNYPPGTVVLHACAISLLDDLQYLNRDHLIYLDPPYIIKERRKQKKLYKYELTDQDHAELIAKLIHCRCYIAISHYPCKEYDALLQHGWRRIDMKVSYRGTVVTESLYMNYATAGKLHETTFVGINKTDRQRIKRKARNLRRILLEMQENERQTVLEEIADLR